MAIKIINEDHKEWHGPDRLAGDNSCLVRFKRDYNPHEVRDIFDDYMDEITHDYKYDDIDEYRIRLYIKGFNEEDKKKVENIPVVAKVRWSDWNKKADYDN